MNKKKWVYASWPEGKPPCRECRHATPFGPVGRKRYCAKTKEMAKAKIADMGEISVAMEGCRHWEAKDDDKR